MKKIDPQTHPWEWIISFLEDEDVKDNLSRERRRVYLANRFDLKYKGRDNEKALSKHPISQ